MVCVDCAFDCFEIMVTVFSPPSLLRVAALLAARVASPAILIAAVSLLLRGKSLLLRAISWGVAGLLLLDACKHGGLGIIAV